MSDSSDDDVPLSALGKGKKEESSDDWMEILLFYVGSITQMQNLILLAGM